MLVWSLRTQLLIHGYLASRCTAVTLCWSWDIAKGSWRVFDELQCIVFIYRRTKYSTKLVVDEPCMTWHRRRPSDYVVITSFDFTVSLRSSLHTNGGTTEGTAKQAAAAAAKDEDAL